MVDRERPYHSAYSKSYSHLFLLAILFIGFFCTTCIKTYIPTYKSTSVNKYVVQGMLTQKEGWHEVNVSTTSSVNAGSFKPLEGCVVKLIDEFENEFHMEDLSNGTYGCWMKQENLFTGRGYKITVLTPNGDRLESEFDYMPDGPDIIEPKYKIESHPVQDIGDFLDGLQFYIDLKANESQSHYYRWQLIETWEYHSRYPVEYYYDGEVHQVSPPDSSEFWCWVTDQVDEIFTLNTTNLLVNEITDFPLHFVANTSSRLGILYSLLINQIALSEDAYTYWEHLRQNNTEQGGLYSTQPLAVKGNIRNLSDPDKEVLGFFQASTVHSKRIFVSPPDELDLLFTDKCNPVHLEFGFIEIKPYEYPAYLETINGSFSLNLLNNECVLCTSRGGTTTKPDFWP